MNSPKAPSTCGTKWPEPITMCSCRRKQKILQSNLANLSKNLQEVRALYEEGFLEEQDAQQLEYLVNGISLELENARRMGKVAMDFRFTIGMPMDSAVQLSQGLEELYLQNASGQLVSEQAFRLEEHIEYQLVENQETGAALQVKEGCGILHPR